MLSFKTQSTHFCGGFEAAFVGEQQIHKAAVVLLHCDVQWCEAVLEWLEEEFTVLSTYQWNYKATTA